MRADLKLASFNLLNLADAGQMVYGKPAYDARAFERKTDWIAAMLDAVNADVIGFQEVWSEPALRHAVDKSRLRDARLLQVPFAQTPSPLPRVGIVSRLPALGEVESFSDIPSDLQVLLPDAPELGLKGGLHTRLSRPVLGVTLNLASPHETAVPLRVYVLHLKSRRPNRLEASDGANTNSAGSERDEALATSARGAGEDLDDPAIEVRAQLRSLVMRGCESAAIRRIILRDLHRQRMPVVVLGDFNDEPNAVTTQMISGHELPGDRSRLDVQLFHARALQGPNALKREVSYTHVHQGVPGSLDHILLSEEFTRSSRFSMGEVMKVDYFNDHLNDRDALKSDHGVIRAWLRLNSTQAEPPGTNRAPIRETSNTTDNAGNSGSITPPRS